MNYEEDIRIDENSLDLEWLDQPALMMKYARYEAEMERAKDEAKERLDLLEADLDRQVREDPELFGVKVKVTETVFKNTVHAQEEYMEEYKRYLDAIYNYNIAKAATRAVQQRKDALENLVKLHGQQYFAGPKVPHDLTDMRQAKEKTRNERMGRSMNMKRNN